MSLKSGYHILRATVKRFIEMDTFTQGAALAFYTIFSLAPVVLVTIWLAGTVFGRAAAERQLTDQISTLAGPRVADSVQEVLQRAGTDGTATLVSVISLGLLLVGTTTAFAQLQTALNAVWNVPAKETAKGSWLRLIRGRLWSFALVLSVGFLLLASLVISTVLSALTALVDPAAIPGGAWLWQLLDPLVSFCLITLLFAMIFKLLPDVELSWREVGAGAAVTALLFSVGKYLIGIYLGRSSWISVYGAAGSLVVLLLWIYYSSQILLFGAQLTYVYSSQRRHARAEDRPHRADSPQAPHGHLSPVPGASSERGAPSERGA